MSFQARVLVPLFPLTPPDARMVFLSLANTISFPLLIPGPRGCSFPRLEAGADNVRIRNKRA